MHDLGLLGFKFLNHLGYRLIGDHGLEVERLVLAGGKVPTADLDAVGVEQTFVEFALGIIEIDAGQVFGAGVAVLIVATPELAVRALPARVFDVDAHGSGPVLGLLEHPFAAQGFQAAQDNIVAVKACVFLGNGGELVLQGLLAEGFGFDRFTLLQSWGEVPCCSLCSGLLGLLP